MKLLCFGDSITQGYDALHPSNRYAAQLADPSLHKKLAATLMRNGFTMSEIRAAFRMASA